MPDPVISAASAALVHVPGLCRHGSKPSRELPKNPEVQAQFLASLRTFEQAVAYGPHQAYVGAIHPRDLPERPWVGAAANGEGRFAGAGELMPEDEFLGLLAAVDDFGLVRLGAPEAEAIAGKLARHPLAEHFDLEKVAAAAGDAEAVAAEPGAMKLHMGADHLAAAVRRAPESDAAPVPALVIASSLVKAGVFQRVAVVAGGSLPKVGMKFQGHLKHGLPVLEDVLGASALIVEADDGRSPRVRLDSVGKHPVAAGSSNPKIMEALVFAPLDRLKLSSTDVDDYATELHNPEITEPQGSGNVPERNYKTIAALALRRGDIGREDMGDFVTRRGMPGFAPTQGHIASALCYVPHARARLLDGSARRVQLIAKGSLFLGRMSEQSDGMSVLLEPNHEAGG